MNVYEYYDDYEVVWAERACDRAKVRYVVIGEIEGCDVVICYIPNGFVEVISRVLHNKAWIVTELTVMGRDVVTSMTREVERYRVADYEEEMAKMERERGDVDGRFMLAEGHSSSGYNGRFGIHYSVRSGESYTDAMLKAMKRRVAMLKVRDAFINSVCEK